MPPRNPYLCLTIALMLGVTGLACVGGIIAASVAGREPHASLMMLASACIGSLSSFLVVVPRGSVAGGDQQATLPAQPAAPAPAFYPPRAA